MTAMSEQGARDFYREITGTIYMEPLSILTMKDHIRKASRAQHTCCRSLVMNRTVYEWLSKGGFQINRVRCQCPNHPNGKYPDEECMSGSPFWWEISWPSNNPKRYKICVATNEDIIHEMNQQAAANF
jgi:hypothetical protein